MRDTLFRGRRVDNGEWAEGLYVVLEDKHDPICLTHYILTGKSDLFYGSGTVVETFEKHEVDPSTVGQYTGLFDSAGMKIFEGDIVKQGNNVAEIKNVYGGLNLMMVWKSGLVPSPCYIYQCKKELTVIGNIHDNSELI